MSLATNLAVSWELTEASGNATDSVGSETLTDNNSVSSDTGVVYSTARKFVRTSSQYLSRTDDATLSMGDIDFTWEVWVNLATATTTRQMLLGKDLSGTREYFLAFRNVASDRFSWSVYNSGGTAGEVTASNFGAPSASTWYQIICIHDSVNNLISIGVNNGTPNTLSWSTGVNDGTAEFRLGARAFVGFNDFLNGDLGPVRLWKNRVLSSSDITELYNSGAGRTYSYITGATGGPWPFFYDNELSGGLQHLGY